ncbi:S-layer homology domain-containing protein [Sedimentibacter sp.]|uniref:S-layer homology domain-containing protein n=1 Tax=Sedimentibacter sp. TaxID=1960295 RepID=UPI0028A94248|nr:S-layer homology domain-containing protein [Sedimentibacter sp.]
MKIFTKNLCKASAWKKFLSGLLAVCIIVTGFPITASAAITHENDWMLYGKNDELPATQSILLNKLVRDSNFTAKWDELTKALIRHQQYGRIQFSSWWNDNMSITMPRFSDTPVHEYYVGDSARAAFDLASAPVLAYVREHIPVRNRYDQRDNWLDNIDSFAQFLPATTGPVLAQYEQSMQTRSTLFSNGDIVYAAFNLQIFYDFKLEPIQEEFETPSFNVGDTLESLTAKNIKIVDGVGTDSYVVTAENKNDFSNTVSKTYQYSKSTETSTELVSEYTEGWQKETTLSVGMNIPLISKISVEPKIEQKTTFNYSLSKVSTSTEKESVSQSVEDKIQVDLPAHTAIDIAVNTSDTTTEIPYTGVGRISYKTMILYGLIVGPESAGGPGSSNNPADGHFVFGRITFGNDDHDAMGHLDVKIENGKSGFTTGEDQVDKVDYAAFVNNAEYLSTANTLLSGQPKSPYKGNFYYTTKNTVLNPSKVVPIYGAKTFEVSTDKITLYKGQSAPANTVSVTAKNEYGVPYYGFNQRLDGKWKIIDESGNENSNYAEIQRDYNQNPVIVAKNATTGTAIFLQYQPDTDKFEEIDEHYVSQRILLDIKEHEAANVQIGGEFTPLILNDGANTTNTASLDVKIKTEDSQSWIDVPSSKNIAWYTDDAFGINVSENGSISFSRAGTYQIYAKVDGKESNRIALTVLPARALQSLSLTGSIGAMYQNGTPDSFDLSQLTIKGYDGYDNISFNSSDADWYITNDSIASVHGNTLTATDAGNAHIYAKIGNIYSNYLPFEVKDEPMLSSISIEGNIPVMHYDDTLGNIYDLGVLNITASDQHGNSWADLSGLAWKCDNSNVRINGTMIEINAPGEYMIYAKIGDVVSNTLKCIVEPHYFNGSIEVTGSLTAYADSSPIDLDNHETLQAIAFDETGKEVSLSFTWEARELPVRGINITNNLLSFAKEGTFHIRARSGNTYSEWIEIYAIPAPVLNKLTITDNTRPSILLNDFSEDPIEVNLGMLTVSGVDQYNNSWIDLDGLEWKCDDSNVQINGRILKILKPGNYKIYARIGSVVSNKLSCILKEKTNTSGGGGSASPGGGGGGFISADIYTVKFDTNGRISIDSQTVTAGESAGKPAPPTKEGFTFIGWYIDRDLTKPYNFSSAVTENITLYANWKENDTADTETLWQNPFTDISENDWFINDVKYVYVKGLFNGTGDTEFSPDSSITRAMLVTALWREAGNLKANKNTEFADVDENAYYHNAVGWAYENGIISGIGNNMFSPSGNMSREQMATILWRYAKHIGIDVSAGENASILSFNDADNISEYAVHAMQWAYGEGIVNGRPNGLLDPHGSATRAEVAAMLHRFLENLNQIKSM